MAERVLDREAMLQALDQTVADAAAFFRDADDSLCNGYQSSREVLSHLVFWHREYVTIAQALAGGQPPQLKTGTFAELNAASADEFKDLSLAQLADHLLTYQKSFLAVLRRLPDWEIDFQVKRGGRINTLSERITRIESHIHTHLKRLRRALRHGESWVQAYYPGDEQ